MEIKIILWPIDFSEFSASAYGHAPKLVTQHVVELWRYPSRRCPGNAVEIADVLPGLFNDLGADVVPSSLASDDHSAWLE
jgi:hypothetical protein